VVGGKETEYVYDVEGGREKRTRFAGVVGGKEKEYVYDGEGGREKRTNNAYILIKG